jgi:predicted CopG family antitoxin
MPAKKDKSVKTSLTQEDYEKLIEFCEDNDESVSQVIRKAIKEYLENHNN